MSGRRITPEEVIAAYRKVCLRPTQGEFFGRKSCCGLSALYLSSDPNGPRRESNVMKWAASEYGRRYRLGFIHGFDFGRPTYTFNQPFSEEFRDGEEDGAACWDAAEKEFCMEAE